MDHALTLLSSQAGLPWCVADSGALSWTSGAFVTGFLIAYLVVLGMVCIYGLHRYQLVHLYYKYRRNIPRITACFRERPRVTIQLPMYNEHAVARRVIDATCRIDYPKDRLQIQVLDDSTDETVQIAREAVNYWRAQGFDIEYIHRDNRAGYKAGALANGLKTATGEFVLIFDADFIPPPEILASTIDYFTDPSVGMVQARWEHLNRDQSLLTKTQAILLDGHFVIEHAARNRSGRFMSFNGTAGMWRKSCIEDAGGWQHDTLTEDLDLSYRAQMRGWKFLFLPEVTSAAELPPDMEAFKQQQYRWAKGGAQTCRKLLPTILRSNLPKRIKMEAFFHLTSCTVYLYVVLLTIMLAPVVYIKVHIFPEAWERYIFDASILLIATCSASMFYVASQRALFKTWTESLKYLPFLMSLGIGIAFNNARAVLDGLFGKSNEFVRTPKYGVGSGDWRQQLLLQRSRQKRIKWQPFVELAIGLYLMACLIMALGDRRVTIGIPFLCLFMVGYLYVSLTTWFGHRFAVREAGEEAERAALPVERDELRK
ncbi:MAG TPA: glycosyltransferase family 2 protein [Phycisphaerae bacterium]|jgi:cellulose synthase/poly-beta-1,6-N-acetylglucosamine synthase-like glycosyltransferase|nr:glycosyltransferase [Phycisphaerae bacterium]HOB75771.1 glycosyltransferase family 2 protein [Phycisphaerae bacterium]HOJ55597.1 glycosyltransferase family 2 protein [Phycisphaerae bacterium]HOL27707.1 glycosyltransferase family 2 protein [Phycisphaerae bacterium]HPP21911.1 glycosyltransferase family 2 protein [Phycisphaerae bacterium]